MREIGIVLPVMFVWIEEHTRSRLCQEFIYLTACIPQIDICRPDIGHVDRLFAAFVDMNMRQFRNSARYFRDFGNREWRQRDRELPRKQHHVRSKDQVETVLLRKPLEDLWAHSVPARQSRGGVRVIQHRRPIVLKDRLIGLVEQCIEFWISHDGVAARLE